MLSTFGFDNLSAVGGPPGGAGADSDSEDESRTSADGSPQTIPRQDYTPAPLAGGLTIPSSQDDVGATLFSRWREARLFILFLGEGAGFYGWDDVNAIRPSWWGEASREDLPNCNVCKAIAVFLQRCHQYSCIETSVHGTSVYLYWDTN